MVFDFGVVGGGGWVVSLDEAGLVSRENIAVMLVCLVEL